MIFFFFFFFNFSKSGISCVACLPRWTISLASSLINREKQNYTLRTVSGRSDTEKIPSGHHLPALSFNHMVHTRDRAKHFTIYTILSQISHRCVFVFLLQLFQTPPWRQWKRQKFIINIWSIFIARNLVPKDCSAVARLLIVRALRSSEMRRHK